MPQVVQADEAIAPDAVLNVPAMQFVHTADEFAPELVLNVPATQFVHTLTDTPVLKVPVAHGAQSVLLVATHTEEA